MKVIKLTEEEMQMLAGLIDAGVRNTGLRAVKDAAAILARLETAEDDDDSSHTDAGGL